MRWTVQLSKESILINLSYVFYSEKKRWKSKIYDGDKEIYAHIVTLNYSFILTLRQRHEYLSTCSLAPEILFLFTEKININLQQVNKDKITNQHGMWIL